MQPTNLGDIAIVRPAEAAATAVVELDGTRPTRELSYAELAALTDGIARGLQRRGLQRGARVMLVADNSIDYLVVFHAVMRAGLVVVPVSNRFPADVLAHIAGDCGAALLFSDGTGALDGVVDAGVEQVAMGRADDGDGLRGLLDPGPFDSVEPARGELAEILYTSGSTGMPKGVALDHAGQLSALQLLRYENEGAACRQILAQPLFHMNGMVVQCLALTAGDTIYLQPRFRTDDYVAAIDRYQIERVSAVPTMWARAVTAVEDGRASLASVRALSLGSAPVTQELIDRIRRAQPGVQIAISYGTTEAGPAVFGPHPDGRPTPDLSSGHPLPGIDAELRGGADADSGVLFLRTTAMMTEYLNRPEQTAAALIDGWYNTGDVMRRDADGFHYFVGRADDMFVCGGENIYPLEVEQIIERHPAVAQAAVIPLPDRERGHVPSAFVVPRAGAGLTAADVRAHVLACAAPHLHPRRVSLVVELPLAGTHKVDKSALAARAEELEKTGGWDR